MAKAGHIKVRVGNRIVIVHPQLVRAPAERATARPYEVRG